MNQDIQNVVQLLNATLTLYEQNKSGGLSPDSPQVQKWKQVCTDTVAEMGSSEELRRLRDAFHLSHEALAVICLAALPELDTAYSDSYTQLSASGNRVPDFDLLASMVCTDHPSKSQLSLSLDSRSPLFFWNYLNAKGKGPMANRSLSLDPILIACLNGTLNEAPGNLLSYWPGSPLQLKADADLHTTNTPLQIITGGGSPERQLTVAINLAARYFKQPLYRLNSALLNAHDDADGLRKALAFVVLKKGVVYWQDGLSDLNTHQHYVPVINAWLKASGSILFAGESGSSNFPEALDPLAVSTIPLAPLSDEDKTQVWKGMGYAFLGNNEVDWEHCAQRYSCNVARIGKALMPLKQGRQTGTKFSAASVMDSYMSTSPASIADGMAQLVAPQGTVSDMVLNFSTQKELNALSNAFLNRSKLKGLPAPGVMCILHGTPGNGKTMAAHALASDLRLPLYQVNYAHTASATPDQLTKLFSEGEQHSAALLFDQAETFFAPDDGRDSKKDMIVAFLVQKAETYPGLVFLTTSEPDKIAGAIRRRARSISFSELTPGQRISLMQKTAARNDAVFEQHVNLQHVATAYKLSARHINRMVCNAVLAASANTTPSAKTVITADHLKHALHYELK